MNIFDFDPASLFSFTASPLELMPRGALMYWLLFALLLELHAGLHEISVPGYTSLHCSVAPVSGARWKAGAQKLAPGVHHRRGFEREDSIRRCGDLASIKHIYFEANGEMSLIRKNEAKAAV